MTKLHTLASCYIDRSQLVLDENLAAFSPETCVRNFSVPPPPFHGRQEELQIFQEAIPKEGTEVINLIGNPGTGKTALALKALSLSLPHKDLACLLRGYSQALASVDLLQLSRILGIATTENFWIMSPFQDPNKELGRLIEQQYPRRMFVFDDFDPSAFSTEFPKLLPKGAGLWVFITESPLPVSFLAEWGFDVPQLTFVTVDILPEEPGVELLQSYSSLSPPDCLRLYRKVETPTPLNLRLAIGVQKIFSLTPELLDLYDDIMSPSLGKISDPSTLCLQGVQASFPSSLFEEQEEFERDLGFLKGLMSLQATSFLHLGEIRRIEFIEFLRECGLVSYSEDGTLQHISKCVLQSSQKLGWGGEDLKVLMKARLEELNGNLYDGCQKVEIAVAVFHTALSLPSHLQSSPLSLEALHAARFCFGVVEDSVAEMKCLELLLARLEDWQERQGVVGMLLSANVKRRNRTKVIELISSLEPLLPRLLEERGRENLRTLFRLSQGYEFLGEREREEHLLRKGLGKGMEEGFPETFEILLFLVRCVLNQNRPEEAAALVSHLLDSVPLELEEIKEQALLLRSQIQNALRM